MKKEHIILGVVNVVYLVGFAWRFLAQQNFEFDCLVMCAVPEAGVGGYMNTSLDLCSNMIGAILAIGWIRMRHSK